MAGKLYDRFGTVETQVAPQTKLARAYAEGYAAARSGALIATNPFTIAGDEELYDAWENGWQDATDRHPPGHVAGEPLPPLPDPDPEE